MGKFIGLALVKVGERHKALGDAQHEFAESARLGYLGELQRSMAEMKEYQV
jgi:hypothetical protein